jgi:hypothetical protein
MRPLYNNMAPTNNLRKNPLPSTVILVVDDDTEGLARYSGHVALVYRN